MRYFLYRHLDLCAFNGVKLEIINRVDEINEDLFERERVDLYGKYFDSRYITKPLANIWI